MAEAGASMTGEDVKRQVMEVLLRPPYEVSKRQRNAVAVLSPCVLLTAEEAEDIAHIVRRNVAHDEALSYALALLTPEGSDADD